MRRGVWAFALALFLVLVAVPLLLLFPTRERCRASGRVVDPTGRHCVADDGYVQLREHVLFHASEAVVILGIAVALGSLGYWVARRRSRPPA